MSFLVLFLFGFLYGWDGQAQSCQRNFQNRENNVTTGKQPLKAPQVPKKEFFYGKFGDRIPDPYYWLRNRDQPEVLNYIEKENKYAEAQLEPLKTLRKELFKEMESRLPEREEREPVSIGDYFYYTIWEKQQPYPIHKRRKKTEEREEVILDENEIKTDSGYVDVSHVSVSFNHEILAYALDEQGREFFNIYFKDLKTGEKLNHFISSATSNLVWANDNQTVFYVQQDKKTLRAFQVYRFNIYTGEKQLLFEEKDPKFSVRIGKTLCDTWLILRSYSSQTTEYHYLSADKPTGDFQLFSARQPGHKYYMSYGEGIFYILSNKEGAFNFKFLQVPELKKIKDLKEKNPSGGDYPENLWEELIAHRPEVFVRNFEVFKDFIALMSRKNGRQIIEIFDKKTSQLDTVNFSEKIYSVSLGDNEEYHSPFVRLEFQSLTQPAITYDYEVNQKKLHFKRQESIGGGFQAKNYVSEELYALAEDGAQVPLSLVYKKGVKPSASTPLLLYAYGSYGISMDPVFKSHLISLLDRGFIYAIAHIRGGSEKGRKWYEDGKLLNKKNTFSDFIRSAEHLIQKSYTSSSHLHIMGGSAGGLLMGAVLNERPDLFNAVVAPVPFVDALATMLDDSIPLTTGEYEEWGNPNEKKYYDYIKSYSPYNNVRSVNYPHILIKTGYHDPRVQYWEPLKWTAKLRDNKTDDNLLLLETNMKSGHFGSSGRLEYLKDYALYYSFIIGLENSLIGSSER